MRLLTIQIAGITPILMDPMSEETLDAIGTGVRAQDRKDRPVAEIAAAKIYHDENKVVGLPATNLFSCLVQAGRFIPLKGKKMMSTKDSSHLPEFMRIRDQFLPFADLNTLEKVVEGQEWSVDIRRGVAKATGAAQRLVRPKFNK